MEKNTTTQQPFPAPVSLRHYKNTSAAKINARRRALAKQAMSSNMNAFVSPPTSIKSGHESYESAQADAKKKKAVR